MTITCQFLSTPSARRATEVLILDDLFAVISIHALREEGDLPSVRGRPAWRYFYPRPPRGGRLRCSVSTVFLPIISIHALREEGDGRQLDDAGQLVQFLSTPSARRATVAETLAPEGFKISIHALREEGDSGHLLGGE